jgi:hypothetical protein
MGRASIQAEGGSAPQVGIKGQLGFFVGNPNQRLGSQMEDEFRLVFAESRGQLVNLTNISM